MLMREDERRASLRAGSSFFFLPMTHFSSTENFFEMKSGEAPPTLVMRTGASVLRKSNTWNWTFALIASAFNFSIFWLVASELTCEGGLKDVVLTLGWVCVKLHQHFMNEQILDEVQQKLKRSRSSLLLPLLSQEMKTAAQSINDRKSWSQRMFSFKAAHGILMFVSWINMTGRIFGSNQSGDFTCLSSLQTAWFS